MDLGFWFLAIVVLALVAVLVVQTVRRRSQAPSEDSTEERLARQRASEEHQRGTAGNGPGQGSADF